MSILERVKNICLTPQSEWMVIAGERTSTGSLISSYVVPLAAIGAVAGFVGGSLIGRTLPFIGTYRLPIVNGLGLAVFTLVMAIVGVFVLALIIDALAPTFGAQKNRATALKVAVYSFTPAWVAGALQILPALGFLAIIGGLYGLYLLYLGLPRLMKCPEDKAVGYTVVVVVCAIVLFIVIGSLGSMVVGVPGAGAFGVASGGTPAGNVTFDSDSPLGKLGLARELACYVYGLRDLTRVRCSATSTSKPHSSRSMW